MLSNLVKVLKLFSVLFVTIICCNGYAIIGKTIGITQITSHDSLDQVRRGVEDTLKKEGNQNKVMFANAQGNVATAIHIANKFVGEKVDAIVAITTPSAQAAIKAANGKIPVVFATVTDPIGAGLVDNLNRPGKNVTGTRNRPPIEDLLKLMKQVLPKIKSIGIVLNFGESNSVYLVEVIEKLTRLIGVEVFTAAAGSSSEVSIAAKSLVKKVDTILLIENNTVASALPGLLKVTDEAKMPVFSSFCEAVEKGAMLGLAFNEYEIGVQTGKIVQRILNGETPGDIAVEAPLKMDLVINKKVADVLGVNIAAEILQQANQVYQ